MDSLYQRLKEMDPDTFQRFCFQLLKEQHQSLELRHVEGESGDEGLDLFLGKLSGKPVIWQCKAFRNGVGKSQKQQIRDSLTIALKHFSPSSWILCLSVDLDTPTSRWFEKLKQSNSSKVRIGQMFASDIVNELLHRRSLRNHFFPNASLDVGELKRLAARTGEMSLEELENVTAAHLEDIIERWKERDARFNYQIVMDGDLGLPSFPPHGPIPPGLIMSKWQDGKTLNVFARDVASLRADPPQFSTIFKGSGVKKYEAFVRTGIAQEFETDEIGRITSDWALMSDVVAVSNTYKIKVALSPSITNRKRSVRLEFVKKNSTDTIRYELIELRPVRMGAEEFEFSLSGKNVPFTLSVVTSNPPIGNAAITVKQDGGHRDPAAIKKSLDAFNLLRPSGKIHIFDLEMEKPLLDAEVALPDETPSQIGRRRFISDVAAIADRFGANLTLPDKLTKEDLDSIYLLKQYIEGGTIELNNISFGLAKSEENRELLPQQFAAGKVEFRFLNMQHEPFPKVFGTEIKTGPVVMEGAAEVNDVSSTLGTFKEAVVGSTVKISLKPLAPVRVSLSSGETESVALLRRDREYSINQGKLKTNGLERNIKRGR